MNCRCLDAGNSKERKKQKNNIKLEFLKFLTIGTGVLFPCFPCYHGQYPCFHDLFDVQC